MRTQFARTQRLRTIAVVASLGALALGSGGSAALAAARYPASVRHAFIKACTTGATSGGKGVVSHKNAVRYCTSALACISKKLTLKQLEVVFKNMQTGAPNPKAGVLLACEKSAAKKTLGV